MGCILPVSYTHLDVYKRQESQAVAMLSHPNIVNVYDVSRSGNIEYIVMELIDGITLKQYINRKGVLNWKETLHFTTQIVKALSHAHSRGIIPVSYTHLHLSPVWKPFELFGFRHTEGRGGTARSLSGGVSHKTVSYTHLHGEHCCHSKGFPRQGSSAASEHC